MSSPLAVGAVSAVLRNLLDDGMIEAGATLGTVVNVSAVAPDTINLDELEQPPRLNLFLYAATLNAGWRNRDLPSRNSNGERITTAPLALDLHFLVTAYSRADFQAEVMLGYAMHLLHERPMLDRAAIRRALDPSPLDVSMLPPLYQALNAADLADQVEALKISPAMLSLEDMNRVWTATQVPYRPSVAYQVSVVLIESRQPARNPLPVLARRAFIRGNMLPPLPTLTSATPENQQPAARLGETVTVAGVNLAGTGARLHLVHKLRTTPYEIPVTPNATGTGFTFTLPNDVAAQGELPAGLWGITLLVTPTGETNERETNAIGLQIAPAPVFAATGAPLNLPAPTLARETGPPAFIRVRIASRPQVRLQQSARLALGTYEAVPEPRAAATDPLEFHLPAVLDAGQAFVRLRVDGVDSLLVRRGGSVPDFDPTQIVTVPP